MTDAAERTMPYEMPRAQRILPLSAEAIAQIHSSRHITSLQGVIFALLENSLDAGATRVDISVDWRRGACSIDDNGVGIPSAEFGENGGLGKLHCTSKQVHGGARTGELHGSSGSFLAELASMSLLSITSTHSHRQDSAMLTLHHGKVITRRLPDSAIGAATGTQGVGTQVNVRDLFGNIPVRIKQRALAGETTYEDDKSWYELKHGVVALLLAWSKSCSVKLHDENAESKTAALSGQSPGGPQAVTTKGLDQLAGKRVKSDLRDSLPILFQAGYADPGSRSRWIPLSASTSAITLKGLICLDPAPSKQCQFLALGITPCGRTNGHNELYDAVVRVFSNSTFGTLEQLASMEANGDAGMKAAGRYTGKQLQAKKGVDRFPMYFIQIKFKDRGSSSVPNVDRLSDSSLKAIVDVLEAALTTWLDSNHFRPRKKRRKRNEEQQYPAGTLPSLPVTPSFTSHTSNTDRTWRKATDHSSRPVSRSSNTDAKDIFDADDLSALSRMRFGRVHERPRSALGADIQRGNSGAASQAQCAGLGMAARKRRPLQTAGIEAGELGGTSSMRSVQTTCSPTSQKPSTTEALLKTELTSTNFPSSDNFGSVVDDDLISAEQFGRQTLVGQPSGGANGHDDNTKWVDPVSKQVFQVNSRTGVVLPASEAAASTRQRAAIDTALSSKGRPLSLARRSRIARTEYAERPTIADSAKWLPGFLKEWKNPVFAIQKEDPIPVASLSGPGPVNFDDNHKCSSHDHFKSRLGDSNAETKLSKMALQEAEVIAQVDTKFILCKLPAASSQPKEKDTLVLIDQHAASERVVLENLLGDLCTPLSVNNSSIRTTSLRHETARAQALVVEISAKELDLFARFRDHFARWGIIYDLSTSAAFTEKSQKVSRMRVTHLPTPIAERCANFPALCIDMLRSEVWALEDGSRKRASDAQPSPDSVESGGQPLWLSLLSSIPPSLLSLLHSRSCRSAIMFNDVLSREQCVELVEELGRCVFPFVCAHGRVSMVPLGDMGVAGGEPHESDRGPERQAMNAWLRQHGNNVL